MRVTSVALVAAVSLTLAAPVAAQEQPEPAEDPAITVIDDAEEAQPEIQVVLDEDTSAVVRRIRRELVVVAIAMAGALLIYVWHTSPSRRLRVATRQATVATGPAAADDD
jgi:hypothetical protein